MSSPLGKTTKTPAEVKRYKADYTDFLDSGETIVSKSFTITGDGTPPTVTGSTITDAGLSITFMLAGGDDGQSYEVHITATTSGGQIKEDVLLVTVASL